jgi:hypothetical protein
MLGPGGERCALRQRVKSGKTEKGGQGYREAISIMQLIALG